MNRWSNNLNSSRRAGFMQVHAPDEDVTNASVPARNLAELVWWTTTRSVESVLARI
jgi:hypothetical protein